MRLFDLFRRNKKYENYEENIEEEKTKVINIDGFELDSETGIILSAPEGLEVYNLPLETKGVSSGASYTMSKSAVEVHFHPKSKITELPKEGAVFNSYCFKLKKVTLPNNLRNLNGIGIQNLNKFGVIYNFPENIEELNSEFIPQNIESLKFTRLKKTQYGYILTHNYGVKTLEIPSTFEDKKVPAISNAQALETLIIAEGLTTMSSGTLHGCNNLTSVYIPDSLHEFYLGNDDYRGIQKDDGSMFRVNALKCESRNIKLYKNIKGETVVFEVPRKDFSTFKVSDSEIDINSFKIPLENIVMNSYYTVDIASKKIERRGQIDGIYSSEDPITTGKDHLCGAEENMSKRNR